MNLHLAPHSGKPIYLQIVDQVKYLIAAGRLAPGDELPTVRSLAQELVINPNTVLRAYRELETLGLVMKRQGAGTYVSGDGSPMAWKLRRRILAEHLDSTLAEAQTLGFSYEELLKLLEERRQVMKADE